MLSESEITHEIDKKINQDINDSGFVNYLFIRLVAKKKKFTNVQFKYSTFDSCYLRSCHFDSCNFTGCRFIGTNLLGSKFSGCTFDYSIFEKTTIENYVLNTECPGAENLKMKFARTLRVNYQQLGDAKSANKAIKVELEATETHLYKTWHSNESYYRNKYKGWNRLLAFIQWFNFKFLDFIWGNGESLGKLVRTIIIMFVLMTVFDVSQFRNYHLVNSYLQSFIEAPQIFLGIVSPVNYPNIYLTVIFFVRLVAFSFFMAILIKRFNCR